MSAPQCSTHCTSDGRGDVLDIVVHQNVRLSQIIVTDILDSDHLPIMFTILDPVRRREALNPVETLTDWKLFQSLASELLSPVIQIYPSNKVGKAACDFAASITSTQRL
jgi:hypothetical protein